MDAAQIAQVRRFNRVATERAGALSEREKALIALAVAHTVQCPYCIDAYTSECLQKGSDLEQMTEAIHVACAIRGGAPSCPFSVWDISSVPHGGSPVTLYSGLHGYTRFPAEPDPVQKPAGGLHSLTVTNDGSRAYWALRTGGFAVVDVSGKGDRAGTRALLLAGAMGGLVTALEPAEFLPATNAYLINHPWQDGFATAIHLSVDLASPATPEAVYWAVEQARRGTEHGHVADGAGVVPDQPGPDAHPMRPYSERAQQTLSRS